MRILGISSQFRDAAVTVIEDGKIVFAAHAERYSKIKNDPLLNQQLVDAALSYGKPDLIVLHEKSWAKRLRHLTSGQFKAATQPSTNAWLKQHYPTLNKIPRKSYWHHESHAAAGVLTSDFDECAVMVIDAVGEFHTATIWQWKDGKLTKLHSESYPNSLGLFYSAVTERVGLTPGSDEYILMGMAAYGDDYVSEMIKDHMSNQYFTVTNPFHDPENAIDMKVNLQQGIRDRYPNCSDFDLAKAAQKIIEDRVLAYAFHAKLLTGSHNLVFMGGVALNCVANSNLFKVFDSIHIMPNPGDAGSSLGAAALEYYHQTGLRVEWQGPYLGHNIPGDYPVDKALRSLERNEIFGIANGRAEFGPRALGNRSLMADPRGGDIKNRLNSIKRRQKFRPFAPVILAEYVHEYFELPQGCEQTPYMQFVAKCKRPDEFPAIVHADGTSRVQTVTQEQHPGLYTLLKKFHDNTGCPMLANTSLNVRGLPIVNDLNDALMFANEYGVWVHTRDR